MPFLMQPTYLSTWSSLSPLGYICAQIFCMQDKYVNHYLGEIKNVPGTRARVSGGQETNAELSVS